MKKLNTTDLSPATLAQFEKGSRLLWPIERSFVQPALAKHLREGTSKYARSIAYEGIESVTLSLSVAFWMVCAGLVIIIGMAIVVLVSPDGYLFFILFAVLFIVGLVRLISAWKRKRVFRQLL